MHTIGTNAGSPNVRSPPTSSYAVSKLSKPTFAMPAFDSSSPTDSTPAQPVPDLASTAVPSTSAEVAAATAPGAAVEVAMPPLTRLRHIIALALSAILSPYLVLPFGTVAIIGSVAAKHREFLLYTAVSVGFSTVLPALYVVVQTLRGKITDIHIMDRTQRGGPFLVAIASSALGALVLHAIGAPMEVWGISAVLTINGIILTGITTVWKISMHVAVLSATVLANVVMIQGVDARPLLILIPSLIWARVTRQRHTIWQGLAGAGTAMLITGIALSALYFVYDQMWKASVLKLINGLR